MRRPVALALACVLLGGAAGPARADTAVVVGGGAPFGLESLHGGPAFAAGAPLGAPAVENVIDTRVGFNYLRPLWPSKSLRLQVPGNANPSAVIVGGYGDVANSFGFVPTVELNYDVTRLGFAAGASAEFVNLSGTLQRTITAPAGTADLNVTQNLTVITVNLIELKTWLAVRDVSSHPVVEKLGWQDDVIGLTLGTRFNYLEQNYRATLQSGGAAATALGDQSFAGIGLTASGVWVHPVADSWSLYAGGRGSVLIGPNNRKSVVSNSAGVANTLIENQTTLFPVLEFNGGVQYHTPVGAPRGDGTAPVFVLRAGGLAQWWPLAGYLSAGENPSFGDRSLWLVGVTLVAGMQW